MGKRFKILEINHANQFSKMRVADVNNEDDQRVLHMEPAGWDKNTATGIEMSGDYRVLAGAGYVLKGDKLVSDWAVDDIVEEQFYPETVDNRG